MQSKYKIDRDSRTLVLKCIRKYDEYLTWYQSERERIIMPAHVADGMPGSNDVSDPTASAAAQIEKLDSSYRVAVVRAIDQARLDVGTDILDEQQSLAMRRAIWLSCLNGGEYNFEAFAGLVCCERRAFYNYKNKFLNDIKNSIGI